MTGRGRLQGWACALALGLTGGCRQAPGAPPQAAPVVAATIASTAESDADETARYSGTVKPHREVDLAFRVSGYVRSILSVRDGTGAMRPVQAGDRVTAGTALARVQGADYRDQAEAANAQMAAARADVAQAVDKAAQARAAQRQAGDAVAEARAALNAAQAQRAQAAAAVGQAEAGVSGAKTDETLAQDTFSRTDDLYKSGSATQPQEDATKADLAAATARLAAARQARDAAEGRVAEADAQIRAGQTHIAEAEAGDAASRDAVAEAVAAVRAAQSQAAQAQSAAAAQRVPVAETVLRAPLTGVVLARRVEVGSLVGPGSPAFGIADTSQLDAVFGIPQSVTRHLRVGQRVSLTLAVDSAPVTGEITEVSPVADIQTRVFDVQVTVPNPSRRAMLGTVATLMLDEGAPAANGLTAPLSAIVPSRDRPNGYAVVVIANEGGRLVARCRDVELGPSQGDRIVVRGIPRGTQVVASGPSLVADGEPLRITETGGAQ